MRTRVTVLCLSVCLFVCYQSTAGLRPLCKEMNIPLSFSPNRLPEMPYTRVDMTRISCLMDIRTWCAEYRNNALQCAGALRHPIAILKTNAITRTQHTFEHDAGRSCQWLLLLPLLVPPPGLGEPRPEVASFQASTGLSTAGQQLTALLLTVWTSFLAAI